MNTIVCIIDPTEKQNTEMLDYIRKNNLSLIKYDEIDVTDFTMEMDVVNQYEFLKEEDAMLFKLRWKHGN
jgi:hypothetical protein